MRRSEINELLAHCQEFCEEMGFRLPPMAAWSLEDWRSHAALAGEVFERGLGWDLTDFGGGDFAHRGLVLFTLRRGEPGRGYAEKVMAVEESQAMPLHLHRAKTEDIINRGGGSLVLRLYASEPGGALSERPLRISVDGVSQVLRAGGFLALSPGESLRLDPGVYHEFRAEEGASLVGEVSTAGDEASDTLYFGSGGRRPRIEEDEAPRRLLCSDYAGILGAPA